MRLSSGEGKSIKFSFVDDLFQGSTTYTKTPGTPSKIVNVTVNTAFDCEYRLEMLSKFSKVGKISDNVRLDVFENDMLAAEYRFKEGMMKIFVTPAMST
jgi:hypothetical protein